MIVRSVKNQTVVDIATQHYGDAGKFGLVLELNPHLQNDYSAAIEAELEPDKFDLAFPVIEGSEINIDRTQVNRAVVRTIENDVISFDVL